MKKSPALSSEAVLVTDLVGDPENYIPSDITRPWADEVLIRDTQWRLGIQRWRIDVIPRKGERTTICDGDMRDPTVEVNDEIEPDRIHLTIKLEKHNLRIHLAYDEVKIMEDIKHWTEIPGDKKRLEEDLVAVGKLTNDSESFRKGEGIRKQIDGLARDEARLKPKIDKYDLSKNTAVAKLSLTIVVKLGDKLTLDVASLGEFATHKP